LEVDDAGPDCAPDVGGIPLLGPSLALFRDPYRWWPQQLEAHGPVFRMTLPIQGRRWIGLAGREANALLARRGHELFSQERTYPRAQKVPCTALHPSITEGPLQRHLRRQVATGFSREALRPHLPAIDDPRPRARGPLGRRRSEVGPGDVVGEVGILQGVARTGSVVSRGSSTVLSVHGADFREAVLASDSTAPELANLALRRLASTSLAVALDLERAPEVELLGEVRAIDLPPHAVVVRRGDAADDFYVAVRGHLLTFLDGGDHGGPAAAPRSRITAPDFFGEIGLIGDRRRTATVRAGAEGARVIAIGASAFARLMGREDVRYALAIVAAARAAADGLRVPASAVDHVEAEAGTHDRDGDGAHRRLSGRGGGLPAAP